MRLILHGYWRSGASYRTRCALNLKGLAYETAAVNLVESGQRSSAFLALNPQGLVPALEADGLVLTQSPAIIEWLEESFPEPPLLPAEPAGRAAVRAMASLINCDVQPLNNLRVLRALKSDFGADQAAVDHWAGRWITSAFEALEAMIGRHGGDWCFGDDPGLADCSLIPQVYSARRFNTDLSAFPRILAIAEQAEAHPAFVAAHPDRQPDAISA